MENLQHRQEKDAEKDKQPNLKGTFMSVMLLGLLIILGWAGVFILFMVR